MLNKNMTLATAAAALALLTACGSSPNRTYGDASSIPVTTSTSSIPVTTSAAAASGYGVVQAIDVVPREQAGVGVGTVAGAVVGGLLGNQVGGGSGRTAATVAGVAGGALAGRAIERNNRAGEVYRVAVRMDNGTVQTLMQEVPPGVQIGERVRLDNGVIVERFR